MRNAGWNIYFRKTDRSFERTITNCLKRGWKYDALKHRLILKSATSDGCDCLTIDFRERQGCIRSVVRDDADSTVGRKHIFPNSIR